MSLRMLAQQMEQIATQMESMTVQDIKTSPNFLFREDLMKSLLNAGLTQVEAERVVTQADFSLSHYSPTDAAFISLIESMTKIVLVAKNKVAPLMGPSLEWHHFVKLSLNC